MIDLDAIKWNDQDLIPVIAQDRDRAVLMLAYANRQSLETTLDTGYMHYWSRSRQEIWKKGKTSGHTQRVISLMLDCDGDALLALVEQTGPACHTHAETCFGQKPADVLKELVEVFQERAKNPASDSYVNRLLNSPKLMRQKIGEEGVEISLAEGTHEIVAEAADLTFHLLLFLHSQGVTWDDVLSELAARRK